MKRSRGERAFNVFNIMLLGALGLSTTYPLYHVVVRSLLPYQYAVLSPITLFPRAVSFEAYRRIFEYSFLITGLRMSVFITLSNTLLHLALTLMLAYGFTKEKLPGRRVMFYLIVFTMFFGGGLVPTYMLMKSLRLINNPLLLVLSSCVGQYNMIIAISFFRSLPAELEEAARVEGASYWHIFFRIVIPLSIPVISTLGLFVAVGQWNGWFDAMIYMKDRKLWPLALVLRDILVDNVGLSGGGAGGAVAKNEMYMMAESLKMAVIVVAVVPIVVIYPFIQKYFAKGMMIGAIKA